MHKFSGDITHGFYVVGEGGGRRPSVAAGRKARADCVQAYVLKGGDEGCPGRGKEVAAMYDEDGGFVWGHGCSNCMRTLARTVRWILDLRKDCDNGENRLRSKVESRFYLGTKCESSVCFESCYEMILAQLKG